MIPLPQGKNNPRQVDIMFESISQNSTIIGSHKKIEYLINNLCIMQFNLQKTGVWKHFHLSHQL